jgi:UrcA family protein
MKIAIALISALTLLAAGEAAAKPQTATRTISVSYADLQLSTDAGRVTLEKRINRAVKLACGPRPLPADFLSARDYKGCMAQTSEVAKQEMARVFSSEQYADGVITLAAK